MSEPSDYLPNVLLPEGALVTLEHGEYSDFSYSGPFRVRKPFKLSEALERFSEGIERYDHGDAVNYDEGPTEFIAWLHSSGFIGDPEQPSYSCHVGAYDIAEC